MKRQEDEGDRARYADARGWMIGCVPRREENEREREQELDFVLDRLASHRSGNRRHVVAGDFNANAPYQRIDPARTKIKTQQAWEKNGGHLPNRVIEAMTGVGYIDTYHVLHDEQLEMIGSFTTQHPGQRVDYIFAWNVTPANVKDAWVEQDRLAKYASDHFPVGVHLA